jgi:hypothetical protein
MVEFLCNALCDVIASETDRWWRSDIIRLVLYFNILRVPYSAGLSLPLAAEHALRLLLSSRSEFFLIAGSF